MEQKNMEGLRQMWQEENAMRRRLLERVRRGDPAMPSEKPTEKRRRA
jgi:hypothetical protein